MRNIQEISRESEPAHLSAEEMYRYVSLAPGSVEASDLERHLTECPDCREELAGVLSLLEPDAEAPAQPEPEPADIAKTYSLIKKVARDEQVEQIRRRRRRRWIPAAAAAAVLVIAGGWSLLYFYETAKSGEFLLQAKTALEEVMVDASPGGLRTDLPFRSTATIRNAPDEEKLDDAETLFHQALAVKDGIAEAHLGLGAVYLSKSRYGRALDSFQAVLEAEPMNMQALVGRGVTKYEQAWESEDPVERGLLMKAAIADFDSVLERSPGAPEARYNRVWVLYDTGRHTEALREIEAYLEQDSLSLWSERLKDLRNQIKMNDTADAQGAAERAGRNRNAAAIASIAAALPGSLPGFIRSCLRKSLTAENSMAAGLRWAAEQLETAYSAATGDVSYKRMLELYATLTPEQAALKKAEDAEYERLRELYSSQDYQTVIRRSPGLKRRLMASGDIWRAASVHHLRGNCYYWDADFGKAESEYRSYHQLAVQSGSVDLIAGAMAAIYSASSEQGRPEESLGLARELEKLADDHNLDLWRKRALGNQASTYLALGQPEESLKKNTLELAYSQRLNSGVTFSMMRLGSVLDRLGRAGDAGRFYELALEAYQREKESDNIPQGVFLDLLCRRAGLASRMGDWDVAEANFKASLEGSLAKMDELEARNRTGLADIYMRQCRYGEAGAMLDRARSLVSAGDFPELEWQVWFLLGKLGRETRNYDAAIGAMETSIRVLETLAGNAPSGEFRQSYSSSRSDPYRGMVALLVHHSKDSSRAADYADRSKSFALREYLEQQKLNDRIFEETRRSASPLIPGTCVSLEFYFTSEQLFVFVSQGNGVDAITIEIDSKKARDLVEKFLGSIEEENIERYESLSLKLHEKIMAPLLRHPQLKAAEILLIFPDGPLHRLPFAALRDQAGRLLIEDYALSYAPSRTVFHYCVTLNKSNAGSKARSVALLDGSGNLESAGNELAFIRRLYGPGALILQHENLDESFSAGAEIIHFAGHAVVMDGKPSLILNGLNERHYIDAADIASWDLGRCRLAYLAGCHTGMGPQAGGAAPWGLVPAFLGAGAPAVVVSLGPVDDSVTELLTRHFYGFLTNGPFAKAKALQQAQLTLLNSPRRAGSFSWMPYVLIGDPL